MKVLLSEVILSDVDCTTKVGRREYGRLLRANVENLVIHINSFLWNVLHEAFETDVSLEPI